MNYCSASLALECAGPPPYYTNDCVNPEVESKNLAITKLVLDVVDDTFGAYAHCNVCANGTECDPPEQLSDRHLFVLICWLAMALTCHVRRCCDPDRVYAQQSWDCQLHRR